MSERVCVSGVTRRHGGPRLGVGGLRSRAPSLTRMKRPSPTSLVIGGRRRVCTVNAYSGTGACSTCRCATPLSDLPNRLRVRGAPSWRSLATMMRTDSGCVSWRLVLMQRMGGGPKSEESCATCAFRRFGTGERPTRASCAVALPLHRAAATLSDRTEGVVELVNRRDGVDG